MDVFSHPEVEIEENMNLELELTFNTIAMLRAKPSDFMRQLTQWMMMTMIGHVFVGKGQNEAHNPAVDTGWRHETIFVLYIATYKCYLFIIRLV